MDPRTLDKARNRAAELAVQHNKPYCIKRDKEALYVVSVEQSYLYPGVVLQGETFIPIVPNQLRTDPADTIPIEKTVKASPAANKADL